MEFAKEEEFCCGFFGSLVLWSSVSFGSFGSFVRCVYNFSFPTINFICPSNIYTHAFRYVSPNMAQKWTNKRSSHDLAELFSLFCLRLRAMQLEILKQLFEKIAPNKRPIPISILFIRADSSCSISFATGEHTHTRYALFGDNSCIIHLF